MTEVQPADLRVSDDERRAVDEVLHRAVGEGRLTLAEYEERSGRVWGSRTRGDLEAVVRDLPAAGPQGPAVPGPVRRAVAVMSDERLQGPVGDGQRLEGWAVLGSARLDLARPDLPAAVDVRAVAVMGEVVVTVPTGAQVQLVGGAAVLGDRTVRVPDGGAGPLVRVHALAVMGSVAVRSADVPAGVAAVAHRSGQVHQRPGGSLPAAVAAPTARPRRRPRRVRRALLLGGLAGALVLGSGGADGPGSGRLAVMGGLSEQVGGDQSQAGVTVVMGGAEVGVAGQGRDVELGARSLMGGVEVLVTGPVERAIRIDARSLMGGVDVTVPTGTAVALTGGMLMGGTSCEGCVPVAEADVVVHALGAMGGVSVEFASAAEIRAALAGERDDDD